MAFELFPYQVQGIDLLRRDLAKYKQGLLALATGTGKTVLGGHALLEEYHWFRSADIPFRALWLSQTDELVQQPLDKLNIIFEKELDVMEVSLGKVQSEKGRDFQATIISASVQSLDDGGSRLRRILEFGDITHVCWDEAHHCAAPSYVRIDQMLREMCPDHRKWGQTATPERHDEESLAAVFDEVYKRGGYTYVYPIWTAIQEGYLCPFKAQQWLTADMRGVSFFGNDPNPKQMMEIYKAGNWPELIHKAMKEYGGLEAPTIAFLPSVDIAEAFAMWMTEDMGIPWGFVSGRGCAMSNGNGWQETERAEVIKAYHQGDLLGLANMKALSEGVDFPHTARVLMGRPSKSTVDQAQMIGRGLRLYPGKSICDLGFIGWDGLPLPDYKTILFGGQDIHRGQDELEKLFRNLSGKKASQPSYFCLECMSGKMILTNIATDTYTCDKCGATWHPTDTEEEVDLTKLLFNERGFKGETVYARMLNLTAKSKAAWYTFHQQFSLSLGTGLDGCERIIFVAPPGSSPAGDDAYSLAIIKRSVRHSYTLMSPTEKAIADLKEAWKTKPAELKGDLEWWADKDNYNGPRKAMLIILASHENLALFDSWCADWNIIIEEQDYKRRGPWAISLRAAGDAPGELMIKAEKATEALANKALSRKAERWRERGASQKQLIWAKGMVEKLHLKIILRPDLTRGTLGQIITHCLATEFLRTQGYKI